jgi:pimeloyl-ACP methyl ester carboxylesterase
VSSTINERFATLSHGRTRYLESGEGPPVLLLHGAGFVPGADAWRVTIPALATRYRVIAPDALGWGPGDQLDLDYSFGYMVDALRELQDALGLERTHVVGHSMGGWLASLLAYESPERVDSLVLVASGGLLTRPLASMENWQPPSAEAIGASLAGLAAGGVDVAPLQARWTALAADRSRTDGFRRIMVNMGVGATRSRYNTERRLPHIPNRTLVVWGSDDAVNPPELASRTAELIPDAHLVLLDGIGHGIPLEAHREFAEVVSSFLDG